MKGITPIISIIILLLITVGLAASAWTYMGNYLTTLTAKSIEISTQKCLNDDAFVIIHNMGTARIAEGEITIWDDTAASVTVDLEDLSGTDITEIVAGKYGRIHMDCCGGATEPACPSTCSFEVVVAGRANPVTVYCP
ncbi:MAG: archaellin/type IV pilin N-terminal domain-containing protein [Candidatus Aenigmarchaeota archaeon]